MSVTSNFTRRINEKGRDDEHSVDEHSDEQARDPREPANRLLRDLRSRPDGLSARKAERRLVAHGPNELRRRGGRRWPRRARSSSSSIRSRCSSGSPPRSRSSPGVSGAWRRDRSPSSSSTLLFAFAQEQQAERAVEALVAYLPQQAPSLVATGERQFVDARELVPGDVVVLAEGDRISADARLLAGGDRGRSCRPLQVSRSPFSDPSTFVGCLRTAARGARSRLQRHDVRRRRGRGARLLHGDAAPSSGESRR